MTPCNSDDSDTSMLDMSTLDTHAMHTPERRPMTVASDPVERDLVADVRAAPHIGEALEEWRPGWVLTLTHPSGKVSTVHYCRAVVSRIADLASDGDMGRAKRWLEMGEPVWTTYGVYRLVKRSSLGKATCDASDARGEIITMLNTRTHPEGAVCRWCSLYQGCGDTGFGCRYHNAAQCERLGPAQGGPHRGLPTRPVRACRLPAGEVYTVRRPSDIGRMGNPTYATHVTELQASQAVFVRAIGEDTPGCGGEGLGMYVFRGRDVGGVQRYFAARARDCRPLVEPTGECLAPLPRAWTGNNEACYRTSGECTPVTTADGPRYELRSVLVSTAGACCT